MNKLFLFFISLTLSIATVYDQNAAVLIREFTAKNVTSGDVSAVTEIFRNAVLGTKKFRIIEREGLESILNEQQLQLSGLTDNKYAVEVGKIMSANYLFCGSVSKLGDAYYLTVRLVNMETGEIENSWDANSPSVNNLANSTKVLALKAGGVEKVNTLNNMQLSEYTAKTIAVKEQIAIIDFNNTKVTDDDLLMAIKNPEKIKILRLKNSLVTDRFMNEIFSKMINLEEVDFYNNKAITEIAALVGFAGKKYLKIINFFDCNMVTDDLIIKTCQNNPLIEKILFGLTHTTDRSFTEGLSLLKNLKYVERGSCRSCKGKPLLSDTAILALVENNPTVSILNLPSNSLTDETIGLIIKYLKDPHHINLNDNKISIDGVNRLKNQFPECKVTIQNYIKFIGKEYNDQYILDNITELSKEELLYFVNTTITDEGLIFLCKNSKMLKYIFFINNALITDKALIEGI